MKVLNVHHRVIHQSKQKVLALFSTLSTRNDDVWPYENWPPMRFKGGLKNGAVGGHGPIRYKVMNDDPSNVEFQFISPKGFEGIHKFEIKSKEPQFTEIKHTIDMKTNGVGTFTWLIGIRWLHDALIEDAFDKVENELMHTSRKTTWSLWVKVLRKLLG